MYGQRASGCLRQFQEFLNSKVYSFDLGFKEIRGNFFVVGNNQYGVSRRGIMQNHMTSFLPEEPITDFRKNLDGLTAGNISECAHRNIQ